MHFYGRTLPEDVVGVIQVDALPRVCGCSNASSCRARHPGGGRRGGTSRSLTYLHLDASERALTDTRPAASDAAGPPPEVRREQYEWSFATRGIRDGTCAQTSSAEDLNEWNRLAGSSTRGTLVIADGSSHAIPLPQPDVIVDAIADVPPTLCGSR
jgi:hypothetical protein